MRHASRSLCFLVLLWLSGCATQKIVATRSASDVHDWQASGRIAVSGASSGGSGSFNWVQRGTEANVQMHGPIGVGHLQLLLSDHSLRIDAGDGQHYADDEAINELVERLGARVPAQDLRYWLLGIAAPGEHQWTTASDTATLTQHDWRIDYQRFAITSGVRLPMKLVAVSGPAKVRIVVDRWKVK